MHSGAPSPLLTLSSRRPGTGAQLSTLHQGTGTGTGYLVPFVAPPSAHPVGPHGGEQGQVIAIGLRQEHRLPRVQGEAGAGVPLLKRQGHTEEIGRRLLPAAAPRSARGPVPSSRTWAQGSL